MVEVIPINTSIKEKIERIVIDMNFDDELIEKYYDLDLEREKMLKATFEEFYEELYEKEIKKIQKKNKKLEKENEQHQKEKEKTILTMYENGLSVELIAKYTNNNQNEIENIINKGGCN